ncbi:ABC transporter substrate-binding protein [Nocardioides sp. NPDC057772]|uniref:ABC transporter substrate-binding protein n=1 Tax=Nocardioides sp. NPDC057772 TaxID=3346245 RepID=UPI00366C3E38
MIIRPHLRGAAALAAVTLAATACGSSQSAASDTLRIAGPFEIHSLEPSADGYFFTRLHVTETLVTADVEGNLVPGLATAWSADEANKVWTFELADGVEFHDGEPMTPENVVAVLEKMAADAASPLADVGVETIRADGSSVVIELSEPNVSVPATLSHYSTAILSPSSYDPDGKVEKIVGTGPYEVAKVSLPSRIETVRVADWRGEEPDVEKVSFQAVGRAESRAVMATGGQADVVFGLEPAGRERVESTDGVDMVSALQPRTILMKMNAADPALKDVRVRQAISMALDRESIAEAVLREKDIAATQLLTPTLEDWDAELEPLTYDVEKAKALLAEAGWKAGADGTVAKEGKPLTLELLTYPDRPELPALATAIQAELKKVGVKIDVEVTNSSEVPAKHGDGSLQMALVAKSFALISDPLPTVADTFAKGGSDWGTMGWSDPAVDKAVTALMAGAEGEEAAEHRRTIVTTAQAQLPLVPVSWYRMNAAVSDRVEGFQIDALETSWRITDIELAE